MLSGVCYVWMTKHALGLSDIFGSDNFDGDMGGLFYRHCKKESVVNSQAAEGA